MGQKKKTGVSPKTIKWIWYAAFAPFALVALMLVLTVFGVFGRMPSFEELENPRSNLATEIYSEDGKVAIRNIRRDAMEDFKKMKKNSEITEDDQKNMEKDIHRIITVRFL